MPGELEFIAPTWDEIYEMLLELAHKIRTSNFKPVCIVGVSRGGWTPARIISDLLNNPNTANMKVEFYTGLGETSKKPVITQTVTSDISGKDVILVDDVADSGESLLVAQEHLRANGANNLKTATIFYKPHSRVRPDYYSRETTAWIIFPWERLEATKLLLRRAEKEGKPKDWVRSFLISSGIEQSLVDKLLQLALED